MRLSKMRKKSRGERPVSGFRFVDRVANAYRGRETFLDNIHRYGVDYFKELLGNLSKSYNLRLTKKEITDAIWELSGETAAVNIFISPQRKRKVSGQSGCEPFSDKTKGTLHFNLLYGSKGSFPDYVIPHEEAHVITSFRRRYRAQYITTLDSVKERLLDELISAVDDSYKKNVFSRLPRFISAEKYSAAVEAYKQGRTSKYPSLFSGERPKSLVRDFYKKFVIRRIIEQIPDLLNHLREQFPNRYSEERLAVERIRLKKQVNNAVSAISEASRFLSVPEIILVLRQSTWNGVSRKLARRVAVHKKYASKLKKK